MPQMRLQISLIVFTSLCLNTAIYAGGVSADHGLDDLIARIGIENIPTGATIETGQVEAGTQYSPDTAHANFTGKTFVFQSGATNVSGHATQVGFRMYGTDSVGLAPGIDYINVYSASGWVGNDHLRVGSGSNPLNVPGALALFNNSWGGSLGSLALDNEVLRRADWSVDSNDVMMLNGIANGGGHFPVMSFGFNGVTVGMENGTHTADPVPSGYALPGRQIPLVVASQGTTSNATGVVSAVTSLLIEIANTHPNTAGNFFAGLTETTKAVLLTGGNHLPGWTNNPETSGPNRGRTTQPIDAVFGVGTVNIDRAHRVMTGGQHTSSDTLVGLSTAPAAAWETWFLSSNQSRYIKCNVASLADEVSILLTWHQVPNAGFTSYSIADFDLQLWKFVDGNLVDITGDAGVKVFGSGNVVSESNVDNVEHLYIRNLVPGEYVIEVRRGDFVGGSRAFCVGWLFPEPPSVPGDINGDGLVNVTDILAVISAWGPCTGDCPADLNGDGVVDVLDLLLVISYW